MYNISVIQIINISCLPEHGVEPLGKLGPTLKNALGGPCLAGIFQDTSLAKHGDESLCKSKEVDCSEEMGMSCGNDGL